MEAAPRHTFVKDIEPCYAYANRPASIGHGQIIFQPFIVALMTE
jgi:protein-L-isoaspartate(D-aspartate) O-methyltransferase